MKAVLCKANGPAEDLVIEDVPAPELRGGEVIVDIRAAALNFPDVLMVQGKYQSQPDLPFSPGGEFAGCISAVADDVDEPEGFGFESLWWFLSRVDSDLFY